jgi:hypothetical protein
MENCIYRAGANGDGDWLVEVICMYVCLHVIEEKIEEILKLMNRIEHLWKKCTVHILYSIYAS